MKSQKKKKLTMKMRRSKVGSSGNEPLDEYITIKEKEMRLAMLLLPM